MLEAAVMVGAIAAAVGAFWVGVLAGLRWEQRSARVREIIRETIDGREVRALAISDETGLHLHRDVHPTLRRMAMDGEAVHPVDGLTPIGRPRVLWTLARRQR